MIHKKCRKFEFQCHAVKFCWNTAMLLYLPIVHGFLRGTAQLSSCNRLYGPQTLKYLLPGP